MKFLKKIAYMLTLSGMAFGLAACSNDDVEYEPAATVEGAQVYFSTNNISSVNATMETTSFEVVVMRGGNTEEAVNVPIKAVVSVPEVEGEEADSTDPASLFTIPTVAKFAAGKDTVKLTVDIDRENLVDGQTYTIALTLNDLSVVTPYGNSSLTVSVVVPQPMKLLGVGHYCDDLIYPWFFGSTVTYEVEIYENLKKPGYIAMKNPYTVAYKEYLINDFGLAESAWDAFVESLGGDTYIYINIEDPTQVTVPGQSVGLDVGYGEMMMGTNQGAYGTLENKIISFPENSLLVIDDEGYNFTTGLAKIWLPGAVMTDFSLELAYGGFRVAEDNETIYPIARVAYGVDVAEIQYAFVAGDITKDAEALAAALAGIEDGSVVSNKVPVTIAGEDEETGEPILEMTLESVEGAEAGMFTAIAIPCDAEGEPQYEDLAFTSFYVQGVGAGELPEVEFALYTMSLEDLKEATDDADYIDYYIANGYNSSNTVGVIFEGVDIKSIRPVIFASEEIDMVIEEFGSIEDYIIEYDAYLEANGKDLDYDLEYVTEYGFDYTLMGGNLAPESNYTMFALVANTFGNEQLFSSSFTTEAEDYLSKKGGANLRPAVMKEISLHKEFSSINAISVVSIK